MSLCMTGSITLIRPGLVKAEQRVDMVTVARGNQDFNLWKSPNDPSGSGRLPGSQGRRKLPSLDPPGLGSFRPPPLPIPGMFIPPPVRNGAVLSPEEVLAKQEKAERMQNLVEAVKEGRGSWNERAAAIWVLQQEGGYTTEKLYNETYVSYDKQTAMIVASQVFESLQSEGATTQTLESLDETKLFHLYALRTLSTRQRKVAVEYMLEHSMSVSEAQELARAIKDHERRPLGREGFTTAPGDCLAFMFYRAAGEATDSESRNKALELAFEAVVSESAKERLKEYTNK